MGNCVFCALTFVLICVMIYHLIQGPIERWFAKNVYESHEKRYERTLHLIWEETERMKYRYALSVVTINF
jgi:hypothetical protein